jgi:hypothetical protein
MNPSRRVCTASPISERRSPQRGSLFASLLLPTVIGTLIRWAEWKRPRSRPSDRWTRSSVPALGRPPASAYSASQSQSAMTLSDLVAAIVSQRQHGNLSSAIRLFVLDFYRAQLSDAEEGHNEAQQTMARTARTYLNSRGNALGRLSGAGALTSWYGSSR